MQASTDTAVQRCEGRKIMHKGIKHANDSLCAEKGHGSGTRWRWCGDVVGKMQLSGLLAVGLLMSLTNWGDIVNIAGRGELY